MPDSTFHEEAELRACYPETTERARKKVLRRLDRHCRAFIDLSPFLCLATASASGADVTPRGDRPGFVHVLDDTTLAIPDWPGNNRLDSLANILENPQVGLLFLVPGVDESLRVNGTAVL
jgi:PPOX class probable FMN-dependent enzyme